MKLMFVYNFGEGCSELIWLYHNNSGWK